MPAHQQQASSCAIPSVQCAHTLLLAFWGSHLNELLLVSRPRLLVWLWVDAQVGVEAVPARPDRRA